MFAASLEGRGSGRVRGIHVAGGRLRVAIAISVLVSSFELPRRSRGLLLPLDYFCPGFECSCPLVPICIYPASRYTFQEHLGTKWRSGSPYSLIRGGCEDLEKGPRWGGWVPC